jgi:1-deoxy-D-xylulose-5-phosphate reductoisomerase
VARIVLTGSGGPCREVADLAAVTPAQALRHPTWNMGPKITIDSATMMNKALELIEARWLFGVEAGRIAVLIHPQSIVHSLVEFGDGVVMAQLGVPDMRTPIRYSLTHPHHVAGGPPVPDLAALGSLTFTPVDEVRFPAIALAREALRRGGLASVVLNAANEVAVQRFLAGHLPFPAITAIVAAALAEAPATAAPDLDAIVACDHETRRRWEAAA